MNRFAYAFGMKTYTLLLCILCSGCILGMDIGSDTAVTRFNNQVLVNDGDRIAGFAALDGGFFFSSPNVTATFDSFFQVSGPLEFNGGTLQLDQDLCIANDAGVVTLGNIAGQFHTLDFGATVTLLPVTNEISNCLLSFLTETNGSSPFGTVGWAFDNEYIAVGTNTDPELLVYSFDGATLTLVDSVGPPGATRVINAVGWRPGQYYLAMARNRGSGDEFFMYSFNTGTETLTQVDSNAHGGNGRALSWHPSGDYVVEGTTGNANEVILYTVNVGGTFGTIVNVNIAPNRDVQFESLDFNDDGAYFAVGLNTSGANPTVLVYAFSTGPLGATINASAVTAQTVRGVSWNKVQTNLVAVGQLGTTGNRVIVYEHNSGAGTLTQVASISDFSIAVENVQWNQTGDCLAVGTVVSSGVGQLRIYGFDAATLTFNHIGTFDRASTVGGLSWSDNNSYLALGDNADFLAVYQKASAVSGPFAFSDLRLTLQNDVEMHNAGLLFSGISSIEGNGNTLDLKGTSTILVDTDANLLLKNIIIKGAGPNHISGVDVTSTVSCENVTWLLDSDFSFTQGNFAVVAQLLLQADEATFAHEATGGFFLDAYSDVIVDSGVTFFYDPVSANKNLMQFYDASSRLVLNGGALYASTVGLNLYKGTLFVDRHSYVMSDATNDAEAISFGDGNSAAQNFAIEVDPAAVLEVESGRVLFNNV